jgi:polyisoprenoid-binding protein YceI
MSQRLQVLSDGHAFTRETDMTTAIATATRTFQIDPAHTEAAFQVRHLLSKVRGTFGEIEGAIDFDAERPEHSSVRLTIQAASVNTNQPDRDAHLRSADFFAVDEHPTLTFVSRAIAAAGDETYDVTGDLTIRSVTKTIVLPVRYLGSARDPWGNERLAFEGEITLNRKDFGLTWNAALETGGFLVGDEVKVMLQVQALPQ